jgi:hypothetical protein
VALPFEAYPMPSTYIYLDGVGVAEKFSFLPLISRIRLLVELLLT